MNRRLFEDLVVSSPPGRLGRRAALLPLSVAAHAAALALALLVPALTPGDLPAPRSPFVDWIPTVPMAPTPPPVAHHEAPRVVRAPATRRAEEPAGPTAPPVASGPSVSMIEPAGIPEGEAPSPCLANCDAAGLGSGNGLDVRDGAGDPSGAGRDPIRTGGWLKPPARVRYVPPVYPELARLAGVAGIVVVDCTIGADGKVDDVRVLAGHPLLNEAAACAVRQWRYTPTLLNGVPVPVLMTVTVRFVARR